LIESLLRRV